MRWAIASRTVSGDRGFALVAALWLLVALSAVGLEFGLRARERRLAAANVLERARARAAAEAGIAHARARLDELARRAEELRGSMSASRTLDPWEQPGTLLPDSVSLDDVGYRVTLRDAGASLDLNRVGEEELRRFFSTLRVDFGEADRLAQAIADWRDADDLHRARGAEREHYLEEGLPVLPRNGPFQELSELRYVRGMTAEIYEEAKPHLTLLGTGRVNVNSADRPVLLALPGMTDEAVAVLFRFRRQGRHVSSLADLANELSPPARKALEAAMTSLLSRVEFETREVEAVSEGWVEGSPVRARVEGLFVRSRGVTFLVWRRAT